MEHRPDNKNNVRKQNRREFLTDLAQAAATAGIAVNWPLRAEAQDGHAIAPHKEATFSSLSPERDANWLNPARSYRPHTRWWWPGNAVTRDGIDWELDQMSQQGIGGVEIMCPWRMYAKGNIPYLSQGFVDMLHYAIDQAGQRDMEVSISFTSGWKFGGSWVPPTQRSKILTRSWVDVEGPADFDQELPSYKPPTRKTVRVGWAGFLNYAFHSNAPDENEIVAVVVGKVSGDRLDADSLVDLTSKIEKNRLRWTIPAGQWRLMVFRLKYTGELNATTQNFPRPQWVIDHFSKQAVRDYCDHLGGIYYQAFGEQFGKTLDTLFCDSFEVMVFPDTIHWSNTALKEFSVYKGYDLARYLPAVWWNIGELTPKVRYDVNDFLGWLGLDAFYESFINWSGRHNVQARIQPYFLFTAEVIQGAGMTPRPEMEVTTDRFAIILNPRKSVAAGGHLYGHRIVSAEAYTFLHLQRYRSTMEQLKIATDAFLRDGVTQFYNHGYMYSPEMYVAPSRDVPWANRISHWNVWWKYYHHLADYIGRCCFLLRQGEFAGDVLIYSPQSTVWTKKVVFGNSSRIMPYGNLGKTLVANGYDFDPVNDDVLQNRAHVENGHIRVRDLSYRFLILPRTTAVPVATMEFFRQFVLGGGVVIALDELPSVSVGMNNYAQNDARVRQIVTELFGPDGKGKAHQGGGRTCFIPDYKIPNFEVATRTFSPDSQPYKPTPLLTAPQQEMLRALRDYLAPDFALAGNEQSNGLTFLHRRLGSDDIYFVTNLQPEPSHTKVTFRVPGKVPEQWDPMTGQVSPVFVFQTHAAGVEIPVHLEPYASTLFIFRSGKPPLHLSESNLAEVHELNDHEVKGIVAENGLARVTVFSNSRGKKAEAIVSGLPEPLSVTGTWKMLLRTHGFETVERQVSQLRSWTEDPQTDYFSGTGLYKLDFQVPERYVSSKLETVLDLGTVGNIADVTLNGKPVGVAWMQPYRVNVTGALLSGANHMEILVTNTLINTVSGMKKLPGVPAELVPHYGPTAHIYPAGTTEWKMREKDFHPLPVSGLIGPVRIIARQKVTIPF